MLLGEGTECKQPAKLSKLYIIRSGVKNVQTPECAPIGTHVEPWHLAALYLIKLYCQRILDHAFISG
jgi:hypothetical protein